MLELQILKNPIKMECTTTWGSPKRKFNTLDEAIEEAKRVNRLDKTITKKVAYKCKICFKYQIGSNHKPLKK